jgi:uncharacterized protein DUF1707
MSAPCSPPGTRGSGPFRRASYTRPDMRVSDAERTEAADRLSEHYSAGRLDQATFNERLDRAMTAKTQSDLSGLFTDLPGARPPEPTPEGNGRRRRRARAEMSGRPRASRIAFLVLVVVIAAALGHVLMKVLIPWLVIALVAYLLLRWHGQRRRS